MMNKINRKKLFIRYLKENNIYYIFIDVLNRYDKIYGDYYTLNNLVNRASKKDILETTTEIACAFNWAYEEHGFSFWNEHNKKWFNILKSYNIK